MPALVYKSIVLCSLEDNNGYFIALHCGREQADNSREEFFDYAKWSFCLKINRNKIVPLRNI